MLDLVVMSGSRAGTRFALHEGPVVVGRSEEAHLILEDAWISSMHAMFEARGRAFWVVDLGSRNGTFVGDRRVEEAEVGAGSTILFGKTLVKLEERAQGARRPASSTRTPAAHEPTRLVTRARTHGPKKG